MYMQAGRQHQADYVRATDRSRGRGLSSPPCPVLSCPVPFFAFFSPSPPPTVTWPPPALHFRMPRGWIYAEDKTRPDRTRPLGGREKGGGKDPLPIKNIITACLPTNRYVPVPLPRAQSARPQHDPANFPPQGRFSVSSAWNRGGWMLARWLAGWEGKGVDMDMGVGHKRSQIDR